MSTHLQCHYVTSKGVATKYIGQPEWHTVPFLTSLFQWALSSGEACFSTAFEALTGLLIILLSEVRQERFCD